MDFFVGPSVSLLDSNDWQGPMLLAARLNLSIKTLNCQRGTTNLSLNFTTLSPMYHEGKKLNSFFILVKHFDMKPRVASQLNSSQAKNTHFRDTSWSMSTSPLPPFSKTDGYTMKMMAFFYPYLTCWFILFYCHLNSIPNIHMPTSPSSPNSQSNYDFFFFKIHFSANPMDKLKGPQANFSA